MKKIVTFLLYLTTINSFPTVALGEAVQVGITAPLSGDFASYGKSILHGVELAKEDLANRNIQIEVHAEDACIPKDAIRALQKLITIDKIEILAANFCAIAIPAMRPIIERNNLVSFYTGGVPDSIANISKYIFSTNIRIKDEAFQLAEHAFQVQKAQTAAIMYISTNFGEDYNKYFSKRFIELGGSIVYRATAPIGSHDFKAQLTKIKSKGADITLAAHLGESLGLLLKQARSLGIKQQFLGTYEAEDQNMLKIAQDAAEGLLFFVREPQSTNKKALEFRNKFVNRFSTEPDILSRNAYDATLLSAQKYILCKKESDCTVQAIQELQNYQGVSGMISFKTSPDNTEALTLKTIYRGQFINKESSTTSN